MKEASKFKLTSVFRYIGDAAFYPFFALYLASIGKSTAQIGMVLMIMPLVAIFINPLWTFLLKNVNYNRIFMTIMMLFEALGIFLLLHVTSMPHIILVTILIAVAGQPIYILLDGFTTVFAIEEDIPYISIRLYGAVGYAIGVLMTGFFSEQIGFNVAYYIAIGVMIVSSLTVLWIRPLNIKDDKELMEKVDFLKLLKNPKFWLMASFMMVTLGTIFVSDSYLGVYFESRGIGKDIYGVITFVTVILEVAVMLFIAKFSNKFKLKIVSVVIVVSMSLRYIMLGFELPIWVAILSNLFRPLAVGLLFYILVEYVSRYISKKNITLAFVLIASLRNLYQSGYTLFGGLFIEQNGYYSFYLIAGVISLLGFLFIDYKQKPVV